KRPMKYPAQRYHDPIMMAPEHFDWVPVEGAPGVCEKLMGVFTERGCEARFLRLAPAARIPAPGRKLYFVLTGDGPVRGRGPAAASRIGRLIAATRLCTASAAIRRCWKPRPPPKSSCSACPGSRSRRTTRSLQNSPAANLDCICVRSDALLRASCHRAEVDTL